MRKLEDVYDQMLQPQKRADVKKILEAVIGRLLEVKKVLYIQVKEGQIEKKKKKKELLTIYLQVPDINSFNFFFCSLRCTLWRRF